MFHVKHYDVIVIGGGHAGTEAAAAAARMGVRVALITMKRATIGAMSCNPAIGGLGKGHLVREIDAMDGIMGQAADRAGIQFRLLNRRKGPAVQGPRAQADRKLYKQAVQSFLHALPTLNIIEAEVEGIVENSGTVQGVDLDDGQRVLGQKIILTAGTFLNGLIHIGDHRQSGGRIGSAACKRLAHQLGDLNLEKGRLKTGTPPRLDGRTINWDILDQQLGDDDPMMFSFLNRKPFVRQISCAITYTNEKTHDIVRNNLEKSAMYGGMIEGVGPRYCPSIEDKIIRFSDKSSHQIFLEPEGLDDNTVYPNGISTSLPEEVQTNYVRSIRGLEDVDIFQPGYAIEYDYFDPRCLDQTLQLKEIEGLYFAGQINGTTGYEEAAAQGLVAGLNAAARIREIDDISFSRTNSYIGVMVSDLISKGVSEPYRMFTSRAEYRLTIRADNADQRLTPLACSIGCVSSDRLREFENKLELLEGGKAALLSFSFSPTQLNERGIKVRLDGVKRSGWDLLSTLDSESNFVFSENEKLMVLSRELKDQLCREALYSKYQARQEEEAARLKRDEGVIIPKNFDFQRVSGLSNELLGKLKRRRPKNIAQASEIEGMTPAALVLILAFLRKRNVVRRAR